MFLPQEAYSTKVTWFQQWLHILWAPWWSRTCRRPTEHKSFNFDQTCSSWILFKNRYVILSNKVSWYLVRNILVSNKIQSYFSYKLLKRFLFLPFFTTSWFKLLTYWLKSWGKCFIFQLFLEGLPVRFDIFWMSQHPERSRWHFQNCTTTILDNGTEDLPSTNVLDCLLIHYMFDYNKFCPGWKR